MPYECVVVISSSLMIIIRIGFEILSWLYEKIFHQMVVSRSLRTCLGCNYFATSSMAVDVNYNSTSKIVGRRKIT